MGGYNLKKVRGSVIAIVVIMALFILQQLNVLSGLIGHIGNLPWWVYIVIAGVLFSGYQYMTLSKEEKEVDEKWLEEQGEVFLKRMRAERKKRMADKESSAAE